MLQAENVAPMNATIKKVLKPSQAFNYEYDFGTTTELLLKVVAEYSSPSEITIRPLIRNHSPVFLCGSCKINAEYICGMCYAYPCEACMKDHDCDMGSDCFLPLVNSPRAGYCGYTG